MFKMRGKDRNSDIFKQCQVLVYVIARCMSAVCVLDTLALSISIRNIY